MCCLGVDYSFYGLFSILNYERNVMINKPISIASKRLYKV